MSRIGRKPVKVPSGVKVELAGNTLKISSSKESLTLPVNPVVSVDYDSGANEIKVDRKGNDRFARAMHGTTRALINNMITGVTQGYMKGISVYGTGYGIKQQAQQLLFSVGMAQPAAINIPAGVTVEIETPNARGNDTPATMKIKAADKQTVGQFAAKIRKIRPPEPYNGKGIRYSDEVIKRKVGKAFASGG